MEGKLLAGEDWGGGGVGRAWAATAGLVGRLSRGGHPNPTGGMDGGRAYLLSPVSAPPASSTPYEAFAHVDRLRLFQNQGTPNGGLESPGSTTGGPPGRGHRIGAGNWPDLLPGLGGGRISNNGASTHQGPAGSSGPGGRGPHSGSGGGWSAGLSAGRRCQNSRR